MKENEEDRKSTYNRLKSKYNAKNSVLYHYFLISYLVFFITILIHSYVYEFIYTVTDIGYFLSLVLLYILIQGFLSHKNIYSLNNRSNS